MNAIREMRERAIKRLSGDRKAMEGFELKEFRPTANNAPRLPQSNIPSPKASYDRVGRPAKKTDIYKPPELYRKKPRDIWGGWL